jgi:hypothetical protein
MYAEGARLPVFVGVPGKCECPEFVGGRQALRGGKSLEMEKQMDVQEGASLCGAEGELTAHRRIIVRYIDGSLLRCYLSPEGEAALQMRLIDPFVVQTAGGQFQEVNPSQIKAIFFVKSFEGSPNYSEFKVFTNRPNGRGVWMRVHFRDGEVMEGVAPNSLDTYFNPVFYLTPPDPASNNQTVLVSKASLQDMQVLGLAAD